MAVPVNTDDWGFVFCGSSRDNSTFGSIIVPLVPFLETQCSGSLSTCCRFAAKNLLKPACKRAENTQLWANEAGAGRRMLQKGQDRTVFSRGNPPPRAVWRIGIQNPSESADTLFGSRPQRRDSMHRYEHTSDREGMLKHQATLKAICSCVRETPAPGLRTARPLPRESYAEGGERKNGDHGR